MRRKDRERDRAFAYDVIDRCEYGVAAMAGEGGAPYCVPLSLVRLGDTLYFHCALEGTKLDCLRRSPRVCVSFVASNQAALDKFTTYFQMACFHPAALPKARGLSEDASSSSPSMAQ